MSHRRFFAGCAGLVLAVWLPAIVLPQDRVANSKWAAIPPVMDGLEEDWRPAVFYPEKKVRVDYAFKNDGRNLYILLVFNDAKYLSSIEATGMRIYCRGAGSAEDGIGILFIRKTITAEEYIVRLENQGTPLSDKDKEVLRISPRHSLFESYAVDRRGKTLPPPASASEADPPMFRAAKRDKATIYEFRIPLASSDVHPAVIGAGPGETVRVTFEWGGKSKQLLDARTSWESPAGASSGGLYDKNGETPAQQFLNAFDKMANPSVGTKQYSFQAVVNLARDGSGPGRIPQKG
jgi:hypothetical protein